MSKVRELLEATKDPLEVAQAVGYSRAMSDVFDCLGDRADQFCSYGGGASEAMAGVLSALGELDLPDDWDKLGRPSTPDQRERAMGCRECDDGIVNYDNVAAQKCRCKDDPRPTREQAYIAGLREGVTAYAWWKDGVQQVGTCGKTLAEALQDIEERKGYLGEIVKRAMHEQREEE